MNREKGGGGACLLLQSRPVYRNTPVVCDPTSPCGSAGADGCGEDGGTYENVYALIPVGGQHQDCCCCSAHAVLPAGGVSPRRLVLLNQVNPARFAANYRTMTLRRRRHHIRMAGSIWRKQTKGIQPPNFSRGGLLTCGNVCASDTCDARRFSGGPLRISYLQRNNPLNSSQGNLSTGDNTHSSNLSDLLPMELTGNISVHG